MKNSNQMVFTTVDEVTAPSTKRMIIMVFLVIILLCTCISFYYMIGSDTLVSGEASWSVAQVWHCAFNFGSIFVAGLLVWIK